MAFYVEAMELKEFISNTITQIADGVEEAIVKSDGRGYLVSPARGNVGLSCTVHFDLSVESQKEGGADIKVLSGNVSEKVANRISFDISMTLPHPKEDKGYKPQRLDEVFVFFI